MVLLPAALSPSTFVVPTGQSTQLFETTFWFAAHIVWSQFVFAPAALSPSMFVVPAGQSTQLFETTFWFAKHIVGSQMVLLPAALSPSPFVVPAGQSTQLFETTFWFAKHIVGSQMVLLLAALSPAPLCVPAGQSTHALATTFWFAEQSMAVSQWSPSYPFAHETSHPLLASLSILPWPVLQVTDVHPLAWAELHAVHVPAVTPAQPQLKSSFNWVVVAYWFDGQVEHADAFENGFNSGFDM